jgi:tRNA nucleotidyltransferase (CCA-adding enzyme)
MDAGTQKADGIKVAAGQTGQPSIENVSNERIRDELTGMLISDFPVKFGLLKDTGLLELVMPELNICYKTEQHNPHHAYNVGEHSLRAVEAVKNDRILRWVMLLHDTGKAVTRTTDEKGTDHFYGHAPQSVIIAGSILKRLKFDNKSTERIIRFIKHHDRQILPERKAVAKAVNTVGEDIFPELLEVKRADKTAQNPKDIKKGLEYVDHIERIYLELKESKSCFDLKGLAVKGQDLIEIGFKEGKEVGRMLNILLDKVLDNPLLNEKSYLRELAAELYKSRKLNKLTGKS